MKAPI